MGAPQGGGVSTGEGRKVDLRVGRGPVRGAARETVPVAMMDAPTCPRCGIRIHAPSAWSSAWRCDLHGEVCPVQPVRRPCREALEALRRVTEVPIWLPWPLPHGWLITGFLDAGDERSGARACAVALSGPAPLGGPGDLVLVAEEPGIGLGARFAGLDGPDPGEGFDRTAPHAELHFHGHDFPVWNIDVGSDRAVFVGEALGDWLWAIFWPAAAGVLLLEDVSLRDLSDLDQDLVDLPFGALSPRLRS